MTEDDADAAPDTGESSVDGPIPDEGVGPDQTEEPVPVDAGAGDEDEDEEDGDEDDEDEEDEDDGDDEATQEKLDELGERIDDARSRLIEEERPSDGDDGEGGDDGPKFTQTGEQDEDQPVDDNIAPPG